MPGSHDGLKILPEKAFFGGWKWTQANIQEHNWQGYAMKTQ
jgi:hypothetical protein